MHLSRRLNFVVLVSTAIPFLLTASATAQTQSSSASNSTKATSFVSGTIGSGTLEGGRYVDRAKVNVELTLGVATAPRNHVSHVAGIEIGRHAWDGGHDAVCSFDPRGGCLRVTPETKYAVLLGGVQLHEKFVTLTGLAGPGAFHLESDESSTSTASRSTTVLGFALRADLWFRAVKHLEFGLTASTRMMPAYRHTHVRANSIGTGIRLGR